MKLFREMQHAASAIVNSHLEFQPLSAERGPEVDLFWLPKGRERQTEARSKQCRRFRPR